MKYRFINIIIVVVISFFCSCKLDNPSSPTNDPDAKTPSTTVGTATLGNTNSTSTSSTTSSTSSPNTTRNTITPTAKKVDPKPNVKVSKSKIIYKDEDRDGVTSEIDCNDNDPNISIIGSTCDDNNPNTINDKVTTSCECAGTRLQLNKWYQDKDQDNLGDLDVVFEGNEAPDSSIWVQNHEDLCPNRKGKDLGCPIVSLSTLRLADKNSLILNKPSALLPSDQVTWYSSSDSLKIINQTSQIPSIKAIEFGLFVLDVHINFGKHTGKSSTNVCSFMSNNYIETLLNADLVRIGQYSRGDAVPQAEVRKSEKSRSVLISVSDDSIEISEKNRVFGNDIGSFLDAKILTKGSFIKEVKVNNVVTNFETCKITKLDVSLNK